MLTNIIRDDFFETGVSLDFLYSFFNRSQSAFENEVKLAKMKLQRYYDEHDDDKWLVLCHNNLHRNNIIRNSDDPFDPTKLLFVDFENVGYGFRAWDLASITIDWNITEYIRDINGYQYDRDIKEFLDGKIFKLILKYN